MKHTFTHFRGKAPDIIPHDIGEAARFRDPSKKPTELAFEGLSRAERFNLRDGGSVLQFRPPTEK